MLKYITRIILTIFIIFFLTSCSSNSRYPKIVYMPDMYYSEAYEPYSKIENYNNNINPLVKSSGSASFYPVKNTISRSEILFNDIKNINDNNILRGKKMYMINCAICHGVYGDGQGFLVQKEKILGVPNYKNTNVNSIDDVYKVIKYGKNNMGSYSSQLSKLDILEISKYVLFLKNKKHEN